MSFYLSFVSLLSYSDDFVMHGRSVYIYRPGTLLKIFVIIIAIIIIVIIVLFFLF